MKKLLLLLCLNCSLYCFSQISVSENPNRKTKEISEETLNHLKETTTIFVLPNTISKNTYRTTLQKHWTITPFKIVDYKKFSFNNYSNEKHSFVYLNTVIETIDKPRAINVYIYASLDVFMFKTNKAFNKKKKKNIN